MFVHKLVNLLMLIYITQEKSKEKQNLFLFVL